MRLNGYRDDRSSGVVNRWCGRRAFPSRSLFRWRRWHRSQTPDGGAERPRDHGGRGVAALAGLLRWVLRTGAGLARDACECRGPRYQGMNITYLTNHKRMPTFHLTWRENRQSINK